MNHRTDPRLFHSPKRDSAPPHGNASRAREEPRSRRLLGEMARGGLLGGAGFLLGSCSLFFGTAPFGIALLSAASSYNGYIFVGLLLSALFHPVGLNTFIWIGVYTFCLLLRLCIRFWADPPTLPNGRPCDVAMYLQLCGDAAKRCLGFRTDEPKENAADETYYAGRGAARQSPRDHAASSCAERRSDVRLFAEHPFLRTLTAAVTGFATGILALILGGFHMYDLWGALTLLVTTPLATLLWVACFGEAGMVLLFSPTPLRDAPFRSAPLRGQAFSAHDGGIGRLTAYFHPLPLISVAFLLTAVVFAAGTFSPAAAGLPMFPEPAFLLGLLVTLLTASRFGAVPGIAMAVLCGLSASPRLSPVFILCAGSYALLRGLSHRAGVIGGCLVGGAWCFGVEGIGTFVRHLPSLLLASPLFFVAERLWPSLPTSDGRTRADREVEDFTATVNAAMTAETRVEAQRARLTAISEAFGALSRRFYHLSGQLKNPRMSDLRRMCDEVFGGQCAHCHERDVCWGAEYHRTLDLQARLAAQLHTGGVAHAEDLPEDLSDACPHIGAIAEELNRRYARLSASLSNYEKTEVFAADYAAMAALLGDALEADRIEAETMGGNRETADRIYDYLSSEGVTVHGVVVAGKQESGRRRVIVRGTGLVSLSATEKGDAIHRSIEKICGTRLSHPTFESDGQGATVMTWEPEAHLQTAYAGGTVPAGHRLRDPIPEPLTPHTAKTYTPPAVCGDHVALFHARGAYFYALISDGMGSGEDASLTSEICTMFLEKMLSAGNRAELSLRMLDGYIHAKNTGSGGECSATVDLMELDLIDGHAVFAKNGAAPTYVVRDGTVYKLKSRSMPIGILRETSPELLRFRMHPGDVVVMVSDGVTQGHDECAWLIDLLSSPIPDNMDTLRRDIIRRALSAGSEDDLSAIAIRVEETV